MRTIINYMLIIFGVLCTKTIPVLDGRDYPDHSYFDIYMCAQNGVEIIKNRKGRGTVHKNGFAYTIIRESLDTIFFRCKYRNGCQGSCHFKMDTGLEFNENHTHAPNALQKHVAKAKVTMAEQSISQPGIRTSQVVNDVLSQLDDGSFQLFYILQNLGLTISTSSGYPENRDSNFCILDQTKINFKGYHQVT